MAAVTEAKAAPFFSGRLRAPVHDGCSAPRNGLRSSQSPDSGTSPAPALRSARLFQRPRIDDAIDGFRTFEMTHRQHAFQRQQNRLGIACGQQVGQILDRCADFDIRQDAVLLPASAADWIGDSGGTYQTIGSVRYSGCNGAPASSPSPFYRPAILRRINYTQRNTVFCACSITFGSCGSRKTSS